MTPLAATTAQSIKSAVALGLDSLRAEAPMRLADWAAKHFVLAGESSHQKGAWEAWAPQVGILDFMSDDRIEELAIMKSHPLKGFDAIARAEKTLGVTSPLLAVAKEMTLSHHEKWNGKGYPKGLSGTQIPLSARILAVADVYDALICNKVYRQGLSHEKAAGIILSERGEHFDPDVVDAFSDLSRDFEAVAHKFADTEQDMQNKIEYMADAIAEIAEF